MTELSNRFTKAQLELLKMFSRDIPEEQWVELRRLIFQYFMQKAVDAADKATEGWKQEDFDMVTDTPAHYFYHATKNQSGPGGTLICYATGDKAESLNAVSQEQRKSIILDALRPAFGDVSKYLKEDIKFYWGNEPASYGAYALYGVKQWFDVMPVLSEPFQNTLFAGEHLAEWQGFMEGALQSGKDAAEKILGN